MDITVLNSKFEAAAIVDSYKSFIWTERYNEYGDFELCVPMADPSVKELLIDRYLRIRDSEYVMIIDTLQVDSDSEDGNYLIVTGKSLESILERRIVWGLKTLSGNFQNGIKTLLEENIISPSNVDRKIENFVFEESSDQTIKELAIDAQYTGDNLYDVIRTLCGDRGIGFKVTLNDSNQFVFKLYSGLDRSYSQTENPYVVFSPKFDNLTSGSYIESKAAWKNVTLVGGEGEGTSRRYTAVGNISGLNRRETFTDARDISSDLGDGGTLTSDEYIYLLRQRGKETLSENIDVMSFEAEAETTQMFQYGIDFFNGDIVQLEDEYGHETKARITELVTSENEEGFSRYPTFVTIAEKGLPEGYLELEYIQSSGTQYIDTGFKPNQDTRVVMDIEILNAFTLSSSSPVFGSRVASLNKTYTLWAYNQAQIRDDYGSEETLESISNIFDRLIIDKNKNVCHFGNVTVHHSAATFQTPVNLLLLACNTNGSIDSRKLSAKVFSCKIYDGETLVRNFVPCKNEQDVIGLYDFVTETFFPNKGTGSFTT